MTPTTLLGPPVVDSGRGNLDDEAGYKIKDEVTM